MGGRVKDVQFGGVTVELGANWVHRLETMIESHIIEDQPSKSVEKVKTCRSIRNLIDENGEKYNVVEQLVKVNILLKNIFKRLSQESWAQLDTRWLYKLHLQIQGGNLRYYERLLSFILYPQGQNVTAEVVKLVEPFEHALEEVIKYINTTSKVKMMVYHICDEGSHKNEETIAKIWKF